MANQNGWNTVGTEEEVNTGAPTQQEDKLDFVTLAVGETKLRVMDEAPHFYQGFWSTKGNGAANGNGNGTFIPYKGKGKDLLEKANYDFMDKVFKEADAKGLKKGSKERTEFTRAGYAKQPYGKLKNKYIIHVINRANGNLELLDAGPGVFNELKKYAMNDEYGDLREYDITITKTGTSFQEIEYSVTPARSNTPRTPKELELYEAKKIDRSDLKDGKDLTPEQCLFIAQGGLWSEVGSVGQATEETTQESAPSGDKLPEKNEGVQEDKGYVDTSKEGALSDEELANVNF
ncbi:phosphoesterase [Bacillus cereus]|nr:phosphoesterase [Bacillus cereus]